MASGTRSQALTLYLFEYSLNRPDEQNRENGGVKQSWENGMSTDKELYDIIKIIQDESPKDPKAGVPSFRTTGNVIYNKEKHDEIMDKEPHGGVKKTYRGHVISANLKKAIWDAGHKHWLGADLAAQPEPSSEREESPLIL